MIIPPGPLKVMVATKPVDFRKGAVSLAALVEHELGLKPFSGVAFIFRSRRANRIKLLVWDGTGLVLVSKALQAGGFHWPRPGDGVMRLSPSQASALFEGLQWSKMHTTRVTPPTTSR
ncbi:MULTISPECIES: IS66 family insertion sequence element accessory protein TnpB [Sphingomonadales]|uniref:IS66 family insertion sequence element accessory protein TnpB n=1 Tax=Sphingomonadales TaxID=204457 RepID=UPI00082404B4|nr:MULTISPECIES: IS66 family insertion sequence element accessory protein TnpB [Sphingomonadales]